jgi:hypothetical protein
MIRISPDKKYEICNLLRYVSRDLLENEDLVSPKQSAEIVFNGKFTYFCNEKIGELVSMLNDLRYEQIKEGLK